MNEMPLTTWLTYIGILVLAWIIDAIRRYARRK